MFSCDWQIHKKLLDAGGLGPVVYIYPARGSCKLETERREVERLLVSGRQVVYVRPEDPKSLLGSRNPWTLRDKDILAPNQLERANEILKKFLKGE